ncbi:hydantoinase B/oxoprolinase family protein [Aneurinibacillus terranovensis]|uniref:hydantoinase B/oxoprolinase family protein n=1 Tax=Aneurinibacillus terranovensis TaxID=278991 RepID=UPI001FE00882|nr:hydantoinase B/oxoprolinase family protein [Aneurinibacillus terranovensis]
MIKTLANNKVSVNYQEKVYSLKEQVARRDKLTEETGHYYGVSELRLKKDDPVKYERFYSRLHASVLAAREVARYVTASPGAREMGESLWTLTTPEGDTLVISLGFFSHLNSSKVAIRFMAENNYDLNPGINDGDVFVTDDGKTGGAPHPGDTYTYVPIVVENEIVGWAMAVNHIMEAGAPVAGSWPGFAVDTFMDGLVVPPMKTGENLRQYTWWEHVWKQRTRAGTLNNLDDKMRLAGCAMILKAVHEIIEEFGVDYYKQAIREIIEESRLEILQNIKTIMVPGRYTSTAFRAVKYKGLQKLWAHADKDSLIHIRQRFEVDESGGIIADFEGTSRWGYHAFNGYPGGADVAFYLAMINQFAHNTKPTGAITYVAKSHYPEGSIYNPENSFASFSNIWAQSMAMNALGFNAVNRALFARGYLEEAFTADSNWEGIQGSGELEDGTPYGFTNFESVGGVAMGAFSYRDGLPLAWAEWTQLPNIGNAEEFEYLIPPLYYIGRKLLPNFCGHGKYRGGIGDSSVHWIKNPGQRLGISRGGSQVAATTFVALGMSGAYPAPSAFHVSARGTNSNQLVDQGVALPRDASEVLDYTEKGILKSENLDVWKFDMPEQSFQDGDMLADAAGAAGGWGDPIERDPHSVLEDVIYGWVDRKFSEELYGVVLKENVSGSLEVDDKRTQSLRKKMMEARKQTAQPVFEWWKREREIVKKQDFIDPVRDMYESSMSFESFKNEINNFWQL